MDVNTFFSIAVPAIAAILAYFGGMFGNQAKQKQETLQLLNARETNLDNLMSATLTRLQSELKQKDDRMDIMDQKFETMRDTVAKLREDNLICHAENRQLKERITYLENIVKRKTNN